MSRVVLDTNVLASGFAGFLTEQSTPGQLIHAWQARRYELIVSPHILTEVGNTFQDPYFLRRMGPQNIARAQSLLQRRASLVQITVVVQGVATHPEDDLVLATAVSAQADYLVTGDTGLQGVGTYQGVQIVNPRQFLDLLRSEA